MFETDVKRCKNSQNKLGKISEIVKLWMQIGRFEKDPHDKTVLLF